MRVPCLVLALAALAASTGGAEAQNIFDFLFGGGGRRPAQPAPMPPAPVGPGAARPSEYPQGHNPNNPPEAPPPGTAQPAPAPASKPVVLKPPSEDGIIGRDLKLNGASGNLRIERSPRGDLTARATLAGAKISQPTEACSVKVGEAEPMPLTAQGRPEGVPRYDLAAPACPIHLDVLEGAVLASGPSEVCTFEAADCRVDPRGMWGPDAASLLPRAPEMEQARGSADRAVRENYRALTQAKPQELRSIVSEQAAFSAEREMLCRSYAKEGAHGFCNARFSEARALSLANRLGLLASSQAAAPRRRPTTQIITEP